MQGPGGPIAPVSVQQSPSGRYIIVRFAYVSEASPAKLSAASAPPAHVGGPSKAAASVPAGVASVAEALAGGRGAAAAAAALGLSVTAKPPAAAAASQLTADDNAAVSTPSDQVLYVIVGPVTASNDAALGGGAGAAARGAVDFSSIAEGCPVSGVASAVDVAILSSDRLLTVRRPAHASAGGAAATEYVVTIEPLDVSLDDVVALSAAAAAASSSGAASLAALQPTSSHGGQQKAQRQREAVMTPFKFGVHDPVSRVFPTPFHAPRPVVRHAVTAAAPVNDVEEEKLASAAAEAASDELLCSTAEDPLSSGDVLLYVTRFRRPEVAAAGATARDAVDDIVPLGQDRAVLRYSCNAYGPYDRRNPHGYAVSAAYVPTQASFGKGALPPAPVALPVGQSQPAAAGAPADTSSRPDFTSGLVASGATVAVSLPEEHWRQHSGAVSQCPVAIRPSLVLAAGEAVLRVSFSGSDVSTAADGWIHDDAAEQWQQSGVKAGTVPGGAGSSLTGTASSSGSSFVTSAPPPLGGTKPLAGLFKGIKKPTTAHAPTTPSSGSSGTAFSAADQPPIAPPTRVLRARALVAPSLTLPAAIAQGGPLLAVLTTHRLLILTPALQILVALPALVPLAGSVGGGLGGVGAGSDDIAASALASVSYGVWQGAFGAAAGAGVPVRVGAGAGAGGVGLASEDQEAISTARLLALGGTVAAPTDAISLGGGYSGQADAVATIGGFSGGPAGTRGLQPAIADDTSLALFPPPWPAASPLFGAPTAGVAPVDTSSSFQVRRRGCEIESIRGRGWVLLQVFACVTL